ncbi:MAG: hypothetical protein IPO37_02540 [Saprospiraceae bacterium]|nr:hypothetical protein [Saprospiraceae bacterium]
MDYPKYIKSGLLIGSGAIESAHTEPFYKKNETIRTKMVQKGLEKNDKPKSFKYERILE